METWVGIDVGLANLAIVKVQVNVAENILILENCMCVDLTQGFVHRKVKRKDCKLHHTKDAYDRISHFLQEFEGEWFSPNVKKIFIERQPITGLVHVEQLLFGHFRERAELVSPNEMHKWLGIGHLEYDQRKEHNVEYTKPYFAALNSEHYEGRERKHDMADALCLLLFKLHVKHEEYLILFNKRQVMSQIGEDFFEQFRNRPIRKASEFLVDGS